MRHICAVTFVLALSYGSSDLLITIHRLYTLTQFSVNVLNSVKSSTEYPPYIYNVFSIYTVVFIIDRHFKYAHILFV